MNVIVHVPLENCSLIWRLQYYRLRAAKFELCSALMVNKQGGFLQLATPIGTRGIPINGHLRGPMTRTPIAERLAVDMSEPGFFYLGLLRMRFEHPTFRLRGKRSILLNI